MKKKYQQPAVDEMVKPAYPFMLGTVSEGQNANEDEPAHAPKRNAEVF